MALQELILCLETLIWIYLDETSFCIDEYADNYGFQVPVNIY